MSFTNLAAFALLIFGAAGLLLSMIWPVKRKRR